MADSPAKSDRLDIAQSKWSWGLLVAAAPVALGLAVWAHGLLWAHENRVTILEQKRAADDAQTQEMKSSIKEQVGEIKLLLQRMDDKLESIKKGQ